MKQKNKKTKKYIWFVVFALFLFFAFGTAGFFFYFVKMPSEQLGPQRKLYLKDVKPDDFYITRNLNLEDILAGPIISEHDSRYGNDQAPVSLVIFSDFVCDFCRQQEDVLKNLISAYPDDIKLIWKDYPESDKQSMSWQSARAGRCADQQNKFWIYHDLLFNSEQKFSQELFIDFADQLELDKDKFIECLNNNQVDDLINDNIREANSLNINGVPFTYVNDQEIIGEISYQDLEKIVLIELGREGDL